MDLRSVSPDHFSDSFLQQMSSSWKHREELHFVLAAPFQKKNLLKKKFSIEKSLCLAEDLLQVRFWMRRDLNQAAVNLTKPLANLFFCKQLVSTCSYFSFVQETFFTDPILFTQGVNSTSTREREWQKFKRFMLRALQVITSGTFRCLKSGTHK